MKSLRMKFYNNNKNSKIQMIKIQIIVNKVNNIPKMRLIMIKQTYKIIISLMVNKIIIKRNNNNKYINSYLEILAIIYTNQNSKEIFKNN